MESSKQTQHQQNQHQQNQHEQQQQQHLPKASAAASDMQKKGDDQNARGCIQALHYTGLAPEPLPACADPTPDQQVEIALAKGEREAKEKQAAEAERATGNETAMARLGNALSSAAASVGHAVHSLVESGERTLIERDRKSGLDLFNLNFPELAQAGDKFVAAYSAGVMSKGQQQWGNVILTEKHVCFTGPHIKDAIPLNAIVSIQPSVAVPTSTGGAPFFMAVPHERVAAECIQLFLNDHRLIQLLGFDTVASRIASHVSEHVKGRPIDRFYNWIDHLWRRAVRVPIQDVQYAPNTHVGVASMQPQHEHQQQQRLGGAAAPAAAGGASESAGAAHLQQGHKQQSAMHGQQQHQADATRAPQAQR